MPQRPGSSGGPCRAAGQSAYQYVRCGIDQNGWSGAAIDGSWHLYDRGRVSPFGDSWHRLFHDGCTVSPLAGHLVPPG